MCVHDKTEPAIAIVGYDKEHHESVISIMFGTDDDVVVERFEVIGKEMSMDAINTQLYHSGYRSITFVDTSQFELDYMMAHNECACIAI